MYCGYPVFSAYRYHRPVSRRGCRPGSVSRVVRTITAACMIFLVLFGCRPSGGDVERIFGLLPKRSFDSIECSNLTAARELLGLTAVDHTSSVEDKLGYFTKLDPFTFSTGEYSFLVSDKTPLGFDPSDFSVTLVARTSSYSLTLVSGDFDTDTIRTRLSQAGYRSQNYRGRDSLHPPVVGGTCRGGAVFDVRQPHVRRA